MSLRFRYMLVPTPAPVAALGGRFVRPRPLVNVTLIGPANTIARKSLLDSAADESIFPEFLAARIGIDIGTVAVDTTQYVRFGNIPVRRFEVTLRLTDGFEFREWKAPVAFTPFRLVYPIFGFAGGLQLFDATFRGALEEVELTVNALYRGT